MPLASLFFGQQRSEIGSIVVDAVIREVHENTSQVTENPVEEGADVTDHVRIMPKMLTMDCVISDTPLSLSVIRNISGAVGSVTELISGRTLSKDAYDKLVEIQELREPITVVTGLKAYENMVLERLTTPRDSRTSNAIHFTARFKEVVVARTKTIGGGGSLADGVKSIGAPTSDLGSQVSLEVPPSSPLAAGNNVTTLGTQEVRGATGTFDVLGGLRGVL